MRPATLPHPFCNPAQHCGDHREKPPLLVSFNPFDGKKLDRKFDACWLLFAPVKSFLTKKSLPLKTIPHSLTLPAFCADAAANLGAPNAALAFDDGWASERPWAGEFDDFILHAVRYHASFVRSTDGCRPASSRSVASPCRRNPFGAEQFDHRPSSPILQRTDRPERAPPRSFVPIRRLKNHQCKPDHAEKNTMKTKPNR
jgi:hypothetical protein